MSILSMVTPCTEIPHVISIEKYSTFMIFVNLRVGNPTEIFFLSLTHDQILKKIMYLRSNEGNNFTLFECQCKTPEIDLEFFRQI